MSFEQHPELSVIVPVLNESAALLPFLTGLARQEQIRFEVILSDGGSRDGSVELAESFKEQLPFPLSVLAGPRGRAGQLNRGAALARAPQLLFLHCDCELPDPLALRNALDALAREAARGDRVAGRFRLEFDFPGPIPLPYRYYGAKATLDRPGCTHGDQGFLMSAALFRECGPFDETLPIMEDTFLAERLRRTGRWLLFPATLKTSPRRFLSEGLLPRQTLNAMISNLAAIGRLDLIEELKGCYRSQHAATRLELAPFYHTIRLWIDRLPQEERREFWLATGNFVRQSAWQIPFFCDVLLASALPGTGGSFLRLHDRFLARLLDCRLADRLAARLVRIWFWAVCRNLARQTQNGR
ncbi:glycosyl transferase [Geomonas limicola]|uniref:Glycosyl transferase n=1 Tax=Geomonas limicola TaxID=2740186 RepID=A0A6V8N730_9BACT|nr:TIGR04283 family arsenosugar biosynthesis glycosyltransferase [Geomonas limicola]GFO68378.1 glycosyl transferase [Geomonas limicola]